MSILFRLFLSALMIFACEMLAPASTLANGGATNNTTKQLAEANDTVMFNPRSLKYHIASCTHAKRCTHCISIKRSEAKSRGGVPCKVCGAGE